MKVDILSIDAWGNKKDGYDWNDLYRIGNIEYTELTVMLDKAKDKDSTLIRYMRKRGILSDKATKRTVLVEDDGFDIVFSEKKTFCPLYAIRYGVAI